MREDFKVQERSRTPDGPVYGLAEHPYTRTKPWKQGTSFPGLEDLGHCQSLARPFPVWRVVEYRGDGESVVRLCDE